MHTMFSDLSNLGKSCLNPCSHVILYGTTVPTEQGPDISSYPAMPVFPYQSLGNLARFGAI